MLEYGIYSKWGFNDVMLLSGIISLFVMIFWHNMICVINIISKINGYDIKVTTAK